MIRALTYLIILISPFSLLGQTLKTTLSEDQIVIGQPITLTYSVETELGDSIFFKPKKDIFSALTIEEDASLKSGSVDFEIKDDFTDTFMIQQQQKSWIGEYVITTWDSGLFILPGQSIIINDSTYFFDDISITCHLIDPIDGVDLYDIKENYAELPPRPFSLIAFLKTHWWWLSIILLGLIIFLFLKFRKKKEMFIEEEKPISLKQRTLIAIDALEEAKLWEKDQLKDHFVELSFILRSYLTSRYNISLLEKTTYETTLALTQQGLNEETVNIIVRILSQSDMVKFAKSAPETIEILRVSNLAKQVVAETSPLEFDNVE